MNLELVNEAIQNLKQLVFNNEYAYEHAVWNILKMANVPILVDSIPENTIVFRARTHDSELFFNKITEIGITPRKLITNYGRCNRPYQSVFYCSENKTTSYAELIENWATNTNHGDSIFVTIGAWRFKKSADLIIVTSPDPENRVSAFDKYYGELIDANISNADITIQSALKELYKFLFESFRKYAGNDKLIHLQTTAYCNVSLMHTDSQADGIFYPSVPYYYQGVNFALNESFASQHLELVQVSRNKLKVEKTEGKAPEFTEIEEIVAVEIDNEKKIITWKY